MLSVNPPKNYVSEFCQSSLDRVSSMITDLRDQFSDIKKMVCEKNTNQVNQNEKLLVKILELERIYHVIDKEIYKVKSFSDLIINQSRLNENFLGNFDSIEKRVKIILGIIFIGFSAFSALLVLFIKLWAGGI